MTIGEAAVHGAIAKAPPLAAGIQPAGTHTRRNNAQASTNNVSRRGWRGMAGA
jgi:hypothetical protein